MSSILKPSAKNCANPNGRASERLRERLSRWWRWLTQPPPWVHVTSPGVYDTLDGIMSGRWGRA